MLMSMIWAPFSTCWRATVERFLVLLFEDQAGELGGAGDVGAFADVDEQRVVIDVAGFQAGQAQHEVVVDLLARRELGYRFGNRLDVRRGGAAATADDVEETALGPFAEFFGHGFGGFIVFTEFIRQPGVGVGVDIAVGGAGQFFDVLA